MSRMKETLTVEQLTAAIDGTYVDHLERELNTVRKALCLSRQRAEDAEADLADVREDLALQTDRADVLETANGILTDAIEQLETAAARKKPPRKKPAKPAPTDVGGQRQEALEEYAQWKPGTSVYAKWSAWQKRSPSIQGEKYATLYARLTHSPAARRCWRG